MPADIWALPNAQEALTIFAMFCATYSTRLIGWLVLRNRTISPAFRRALEAAPGCVMAAIVAPQFMTTDPITIAASQQPLPWRFGAATWPRPSSFRFWFMQVSTPGYDSLFFRCADSEKIFLKTLAFFLCVRKIRILRRTMQRRKQKIQMCASSSVG